MNADQLVSYLKSRAAGNQDRAEADLATALSDLPPAGAAMAADTLAAMTQTMVIYSTFLYGLGCTCEQRQLALYTVLAALGGTLDEARALGAELVALAGNHGGAA